MTTFTSRVDVQGQQHKTVDTVRLVLGQFYGITTSGYPGIGGTSMSRL